MNEICTLCPRACGGKDGYCGTKNAETAEVAVAMLHKFEEPFISGTKGSGTVFFARCNMSCAYCQNFKISRALNSGFQKMNASGLADVFLFLQKAGAHNINLVTPTHYSDIIIGAVKTAKVCGLKIPIVYNTNGYEKREVIESLKDTVDVFLTDFKYFDNAYALKYSNCADYSGHAFPSLLQMVENTGNFVFDKDGMMLKGVVVRHLTLPGLLADSKRILAHLYLTFGDKIFFSIMNQYTPTDGLDKIKFPELNRPVPKKQYRALIDYAISLGITNALIQEGGTVSESFIPDFNGSFKK